MRTLIVGVIAGAVLALFALPLGGGEVSADNPPHKMGAGATADGCAGCHRTHTGKAGFILKQDQSGLCYSCHDRTGTGSALDVQDGENRNLNTALKGGGFENALIDTSDPSLPPTAAIGDLLTGAQTVTSAHTIDSSPGFLWGNGGLNSGYGPSYNLRCGACHDPHGNGQYRILRPVPPGSGGGGQSVTDEDPKDYDTDNYFDVSYIAAGTEISNWCAQCHTRYLAASGSATTDSGDAIFMYRHASDGNAVPTCIKCHVAHGTNAVTDADGESEGVPWPDNSSATGENSRLLKMDNRGICQKCHNK